MRQNKLHFVNLHVREMARLFGVVHKDFDLIKLTLRFIDVLYTWSVSPKLTRRMRKKQEGSMFDSAHTLLKVKVFGSEMSWHVRGVPMMAHFQE